MEATEVERQLLKSYQKSRMDCETKAVNAIKKNPKYFFSYARKFSSVKITIGPFVDAANKLVTDSLRVRSHYKQSRAEQSRAERSRAERSGAARIGCSHISRAGRHIHIYIYICKLICK